MDISTLPPIPMPKTGTPAMTGSAPKGIVGKVILTAAALATAGGGGYVATQNIPRPTDPVPKVAPEDNPKTAPKDEPKTPSPYEHQIRAAWDISTDQDIHRKRLIYLYRATLTHAKTAKNLSEIHAVASSNEKSLDLAGRLGFVRGVARTRWTEKIPEKPPTGISDELRGRIVGFFVETIAILEKLS